MNKSTLLELKRNWQKSSVRRMSFQKMRLYHHGILVGYKRLFGVRLRYYLTRMKKGTAWSYVDQHEMEKFIGLLRKKLTDANFLSVQLPKIAGNLKKDYSRCLTEIKKFPTNWQKYSNRELVKAYLEYREIDNSISIYHWILFVDFETVLAEVFEKMMREKGFSQKEIKQILTDLSEPSLITPLDMERLSLLEISLLQDNEQRKTLLVHQKKFAFQPMYDINYDQYDIHHFEKELKKIITKFSRPEILGEIESIHQIYINRKKKNKLLMKLFKNDKAITSIAEFYIVFAAYKDRKPFVRDQICYYAQNLFREIAKRLSFSLTEVLFLTDEELIGGLKGKQVPMKPEIKRRISNSAYFQKDGKAVITTDEQDLKKIDHFLKTKDCQMIRGITASSGKAMGPASIVISNTDFSKFKKNDVLIAAATRPDYVPLMKQASAIVTDEGGLLSHAAIVSRELKIPCVVGTNKATQVLKDGDLVEVDADKGIVKILRREK
jgi:phosphohistidine swiveling domain-containing protein